MSPEEKLRAAMVALQLAKNHMTKGDWYRDELIRPTAGYKFGVFNGHERVAIVQPDDAEVVVILHRTIDAQIGVLRAVLDAVDIEQNWPTLIYTEAALALADAILGDPA